MVSPCTVMVPAVASWRPLSIRMMVDLPEPDRPMMTKISPGETAKLASMTAAVPASATCVRLSPALSRLTACFGFFPKTL